MEFLTKALALSELRPGERFSWQGEDYANLVWEDTRPKPTEAEINAKYDEIVAEEPWRELRSKRDRLLANTDWVTLKAVDASSDGLGIQLPQVWIDYRQALRDLPANTTDPLNPVWPELP